ncbi:hypothetical protein [Bacillus sp. JJ1521]|uniref:hypothetical protein n=1 Tax=Bacillus sp. JJ1521 TaxID=3122957 RepID=UPI002FFF25E0
MTYYSKEYMVDKVKKNRVLSTILDKYSGRLLGYYLLLEPPVNVSGMKETLELVRGK